MAAVGLGRSRGQKPASRADLGPEHSFLGRPGTGKLVSGPSRGRNTASHAIAGPENSFLGRPGAGKSFPGRPGAAKQFPRPSRGRKSVMQLLSGFCCFERAYAASIGLMQLP